MYTYIYVCVCSWTAVFHLNMFDKILKTHLVYKILLRLFQVS